MVFVSNKQWSQILKPSEKPLGSLTALVAAKLPAIRYAAVFAVRSNQFNVKVILQPLIEFNAIKGGI